MSDGPLSVLSSWESFLPPNAVVMAKRVAEPSMASATPTETEVAAAVTAVSSVRFGFEVPDLRDPAAKAMFDKILIALELRPAEFAVFTTVPAGFEGGTLIRLSASVGDTVGVFSPRGNGTLVTTYSLKAMLADPGLKKTVWAHLKDAVARGR